MLTPAQLRDASRLYLQAAEEETTLDIKRRLASHALALAQLAEHTEHRSYMDKVAGYADSKHGQRTIAEAVDRWRRNTIDARVKRAD